MREDAYSADEIYNLKKVTDIPDTVQTTFEQMSSLISQMRESLDRTLDALLAENGKVLHKEKNQTKTFQRWSNIITANVFKALRLMQKKDMPVSYEYGKVIYRLQNIVNGHRDIVMRAYHHVSNHHMGLTDAQAEEVRQVKVTLVEALAEVERIVSSRQLGHTDALEASSKQLQQMADQFYERQLERIHSRESKTRLSILYYAVIGNARMLVKQSVKLLDIQSKSLGRVTQTDLSDASHV
jgi:hypothetical protein